MGHRNLHLDCSVFCKRVETGVTNIILAYVDDLMFVSNDTNVLPSEVSKFLYHFEGTISSLEWYLGVRILIDEKCLVISQTAHILYALLTFVLEDCRPHSKPMILPDCELHRNMICTSQVIAKKVSTEHHVSNEYFSVVQV